MGLKLKTAPATEPVTLAEIKSHLRISVDDGSEDSYLESLITAARERAEKFTSRAFINQTWEWALDRFPVVRGDGSLIVPRAPLVSVTSLKYIDSAGVEQTFSASKYDLDIVSAPGRIIPSYGESWPDPRAQANAITIEFVAGYGADASYVPKSIHQAILMICGHLYENREDVATGAAAQVIPMNSQWLLEPFQIWSYE